MNTSLSYNFFCDVCGERYSTKNAADKCSRLPLGPEDVLPGSMIRRKGQTDEYGKPQHWHWRFISYVTGIGPVCADRGYNWQELFTDYEINRSLPLAGKWDANAWEPCKKLGAAMKWQFLPWLFDRRRSCADCSLNEAQNALLIEEREDMACKLRRLELDLAEARAAASEMELVRQYLVAQRDCFEAEVEKLQGLLARERRWNEELRTELRLTRGNVFLLQKFAQRVEVPVEGSMPGKN